MNYFTIYYYIIPMKTRICLCQVIVGTFSFLFDICLFVLFSDYLEGNTPDSSAIVYEQNALAKAFLDAVLIASNKGI